MATTSWERSTALVVLIDILLLLVLLDSAALSLQQQPEEEANVNESRPHGAIDRNTIPWPLLNNTVTACSRVICNENQRRGITPGCRDRPDLLDEYATYCGDSMYPFLYGSCNNIAFYRGMRRGEMTGLPLDVKLLRDSCVEFCRNASEADQCPNPAQCEKACNYVVYIYGYI